MGALGLFPACDSARYFHYFRAISIALLCLVRLKARCYCADREISSSPGDPRKSIRNWGVSMRKMHLFYAAIGFAVARWIFKRPAVVDPVSRLRSQGLL